MLSQDGYARFDAHNHYYVKQEIRLNPSPNL